MPNPYFNIMPRQVAAAEAPSVINIPQNTLTFAGAPTVVTLIIKVLAATLGITDTKPLILGLSLLIGLLIYWNTAATGETTKAKTLGVLFAIINSFAIAAAALGLDTASLLIE